MEVFFKASVTDTNGNFIADLSINSMTSSAIIATINDFSETLKASMSESALNPDSEYVDGDDSLYISRSVKLFIYDDIRGILEYTASVSYRLKTLVHFDSFTLISTVQRRNDVKAKVLIQSAIVPIMQTVTAGKTESIKLLNKSIPGTIVDLSAGGIAFACSAELEEDTVYSLTFDRTPRAVETILKVMRHTQKQDGSHIYGCKFDNITSKDEELIRQFVFKTLAEKHAGSRR